MSVKDQNYCRKCPICGDVLPGTDDGLEVYESLKDQISAGIEVPSCTLCGTDVEGGIEAAKNIVARGEPILNEVK